MKVTDYERVNSVQDSDVLLIDGNRGTKTIYVDDLGFANEKTIREEQRVLGAKNLIFNIAKSQVINGVTFTVNDDKTVTISGKNTGTRQILFSLSQGIFPKIPDEWKGKELILSASGGNSGVALIFMERNSNGVWLRQHNSNLNPNKFILGDDAIKYEVVIYVIAGATVSETLYPMLRLASDHDDTYVPYAMTNRELTEKITKVETGTISGALGHTIKWRKSGRVVELNVANDTTKIPNGATDIAILPTDLIPKLAVTAECYKVYINKCSYIIDPPTGKLQIYCNIATGSSSPYYVVCSMIYII